MLPLTKADLRSLFEQALDLSPINRAHFLRDIQFRSPLVYGDLRNLLIAHEGPSAFFEQDGGIWNHITPTDFTGRRFGAYSIVEEIGRGGMGAVFKASRADDAFYKTVAIKLISGGVVLSATALDSFRRERQILAQLEHPNIARLLDGGATDDGLLYLIMEFVDGQPIDKFVESHQPSVVEVLRLFLKAAAAVSFAHRNLIVHRDLKPSNILVTEEGDVKLLDFGIAKVLNPDRNDTATIALRLTPEFASPEQIRGGAISTASDVYSLGVLLFHVLTGGARPFGADSQAVPEILKAVLECETPRPSSVALPHLAKNLRGDLDNIILKAMAKEPERRYASVDQFCEDIERHLNKRPILARADNWSYRASKFVRRNRLPASAAALLVVSITAGTLTTLNQSRLAQLERAEAVGARSIAESQRRDALAQRQIALQSQQQADKQRLVAELRTNEALTERGRAETRYQSVRSLATAILFDVNESLRDLPGSGPARKQAVLAAIKHLEALSEKSFDDLALTEDLAIAYEQTAEISTTLFENPREVASVAIPALLKAVPLRYRLVKSSQATSQHALKLAETKRLLGNSYLNGAQPELAIQAYRDSLSLASIAQPTPSSQRIVALARGNLCTANTILNFHNAALTDCSEAVRIFTSLDTSAGSDIVRLRLLTHMRYGKALTRIAQFPAAMQEFQMALLDFDPMDAPSAPLLEELLKALQELPPGSASDSILALANRKHGVLLSRKGSRDQALEVFELAMRTETSSTPAMKDVVAYAEACMLQSEAHVLRRNGQVQLAIEVSKKALSRIGESTSGSTSLLRTELEANLRSFESTLAQPLR